MGKTERNTMCQTENALIATSAETNPSPLPPRRSRSVGTGHRLPPPAAAHESHLDRTTASLFRVAATADEMLTKQELAARLKVTERTVENWQVNGLLPYFKVSCCVLFYWPDVIEHLKTHFRVSNHKAM